MEDGNKAVIDRLTSLGTLLANVPYTHRYPFDWRTKKPIMLRATKQWFINLSRLKDDALAALADVTVGWGLRDGGKDRMVDVLNVIPTKDGAAEWSHTADIHGGHAQRVVH